MRVYIYPIPSGEAGCVYYETTEGTDVCCWRLLEFVVTGASRLSKNWDNYFVVDWSSLRTAS
jgi:hypothetical protein